MTHDQIQDLLEDYVDDVLDRPTRKEVDTHLGECAQCRAILDGVAPIDLAGLGGTWDTTSMRRAVRRSMFRTAFDVVAIVFIGWLVVLVLSTFLIQPLLINRGGRAEAATVASADLVVLFNPGVSITDYRFDSGMLSRSSTVTPAYPLGAAVVELEAFGTRLGITGFGGIDGGHAAPWIDSSFTSTGDIADQLATFGDGTVATVVVVFTNPLEIAQAQALADDRDIDVRVVWSGFATPSAGTDTSPFGPAGLGYAACGAVQVMTAGTGSGGGSGTAFGAPSSIEQARSEAVRALTNLIEHPEFIDGLASSDIDGPGLEAALGDLTADPQVSSLVVTGPTPELLRFVGTAPPSTGSIIDVDFNNWFRPLCGR